jgi:hypothetical protein
MVELAFPGIHARCGLNCHVVVNGGGVDVDDFLVELESVAHLRNWTARSELTL